MLTRLKAVPFWNDPLLNFVKVIGVLVVLLAGLVFVSTASATDDWAWYSHDFTAVPIRLVIYHSGQQTYLAPGLPGFQPLAEAVRASLASGVTMQSSTGLSDDSLKEARSRYTTLEAFFGQPVKVHAGFFTGHPTQMLFPVTGRHSEWPIVFLGVDGAYLANAPVLKTTDPILTTLHSLGYIP